jgi:hypothetical protein
MGRLPAGLRDNLHGTFVSPFPVSNKFNSIQRTVKSRAWRSATLPVHSGDQKCQERDDRAMVLLKTVVLVERCDGLKWRRRLARFLEQSLAYFVGGIRIFRLQISNWKSWKWWFHLSWMTHLGSCTLTHCSSYVFPPPQLLHNSVFDMAWTNVRSVRSPTKRWWR